MNDNNYTTIRAYTCPLCGCEVRDNYFWYGEMMGDSHFLYDSTPCCKVIVLFIIIEGVPIYLGTFRNTNDMREFTTSAGGERRDLWPAGSQWDHEKQGRKSRDTDEIPF